VELIEKADKARLLEKKNFRTHSKIGPKNY